jgi:hypothetical protein
MSRTSQERKAFQNCTIPLTGSCREGVEQNVSVGSMDYVILSSKAISLRSLFTSPMESLYNY